MFHAARSASPRSDGSPRRCRCTASAASRRGCRSRWAATRSARTASSPPCAGARSRGGRARSSPRSTGLAAEGVKEITLLGQNVNSWGRDLGTEFGELLRACDAVDGIERIRFTSPHPKDFRRPVIEAMAECDAVCEHTHLPLQSGSTRVLKAMRRTYSRERYLRLVERAARGDSRPRAHDGHHRRLPGRDRGRLPRDARGRRGGRLRRRVHVRLLAAAGDRSGGDDRPGPGRGEARADRAARRRRAARRARAQPGAGRPVEEVLVEGPSRTDPSRSCAGGRAATRRSTSPATRSRASS